MINKQFCEWSCLTFKEYHNLSIRQKIKFNKICGIVF